jgi:hypothetical protein
MSIAARHHPRVSIGALPLVVALMAAFVFGGIGGYAARTLNSAPAAGAAVSACPAGSHAVVWYTARSWACVSDMFVAQ